MPCVGLWESTWYHSSRGVRVACGTICKLMGAILFGMLFALWEELAGGGRGLAPYWRVTTFLKLWGCGIR